MALLINLQKLTKPELNGQLHDHYLVTLIKTVLWLPGRRKTGRFFIIYIIINKICAALRSQKCMVGPLGSPKNMCIPWLHKIPFLHFGKRVKFPTNF